MNKYLSFHKIFFPFITDIIDSVRGKSFWPLIASLIGAAGSAYAASQQPDSITQTMQYIPPTLNPQQQGLQNLIYYGAMSNLYGGQNQGYGDLLNQYIYGGLPSGNMVAGATGGTTGTANQSLAEQIISGYEGQVAQAEETEGQLKELKGDIKSKTLEPYIKYLRNLDSLSIDERISKKNEVIKMAKKTSQQLADLAGMDKREADALTMQMNNMALWGYGATYTGKPGSKGMLSATIHAKDMGYSGDLENDIDNFIADQWVPGSESITLIEKYNLGNYGTEENIDKEINEFFPTAETSTPTTEATTVTAGEATVPTEGILGKIMDTDWIAEQFGLAKEQGMQEIGDWYEQAQREFEQRGIGQYGGYMGSQTERDLGSLLSERGRMETQLGSGLRQAQIGLERQNWYDVLNSLTGLQTLQSQLQSARITPWLTAASNMANAPYGKSTTTPYQGVGILPAAISGAYTGAGLADMLGNWGQKKQQPATSPGTTSGFQLAGTQNLWNRYYGG